MPLHYGHSKAIISANIGELIKSGYPKKQAAAIAFDKARESRKANKTTPRKKASYAVKQLYGRIKKTSK